MKSNTLNSMTQANSDIVRANKKANVEDIENAENTLQVRFPRLYKSILTKHGVIKIYNRLVFGLGPATKRLYGNGRSVVFQTVYARDSIELPSRYIVIWHESHGDVWCLDTKSRSERCPVWHLDPEVRTGNSMKPVRVAASLIEWIEKIIVKQRENRALLDREMPGVHTPMGKFRTRKGKAKFLAKLREREAKKVKREARATKVRSGLRSRKH